jgi:hypothetical protein
MRLSWICIVCRKLPGSSFSWFEVIKSESWSGIDELETETFVSATVQI